MPRHYTGKEYTGLRRVTQKNGDIYVYQRVTRYDREQRKTVTVSNKLLGKLDPVSQQIVPTRPRKVNNKGKRSPKLNLKHWLEARSLIQILDWFGCIEQTSVTTPRSVQRWSTESVQRD